MGYEQDSHIRNRKLGLKTPIFRLGFNIHIVDVHICTLYFSPISWPE